MRGRRARVFIGFTDPRSLRTEAPRLTAARCCGGWIVAARKGQSEIANDAQLAARRLPGAADFFRNIGDRNLPIRKPLETNARTHELVADRVEGPERGKPSSLQCPGRGPGKRLVWTFGNPRIIPTRTFPTAGGDRWPMPRRRWGEAKTDSSFSGRRRVSH